MFLFDERLFDADYFAQRMRESRQRKRRIAVEMRMNTRASRSDNLNLDVLPEIAAIDGLESALNTFVSAAGVGHLQPRYAEPDRFDMESYRNAILEYLAGVSAHFSAIPKIIDDIRADRVRRFVTLVFMEHEGEVKLTQQDRELLVEINEAYTEG